ncbi:MAG TPA: hypothetical protein DC042_01305 [Bacteroidales bacterium]|nr:hypothetical protein [Bacteroidales bacterium]
MSQSTSPPAPLPRSLRSRERGVEHLPATEHLSSPRKRGPRPSAVLLAKALVIPAKAGTAPLNFTLRMRTLLLSLLLLSLISCSTPGKKSTDPAHASYWKDQVLTDILPFWKDHARDTADGGFYTTLDSAWKPVGDQRKFPSMLSRHLFGFSVGYLLSGDPDYLMIARETYEYLLDHAWDKEFGGWYDVLDEKGNPLEATKSMFIQVYSITGLAMYYFVTRDPGVLEYIEKSNNLLESKAWDSRHRGYFNGMTRDWQVLDSTKSISSEITPISGYLFYLYLATRDPKYLDQAARILDVVTGPMMDPETGWILENFTPDWQYLPGREDETEVSTGHNIEVAWMLDRYYLITQEMKYRKMAEQLTGKIYRYGNNPDTGFWYNTIGRTYPEQHPDQTYWWVQAYGQMFDLISYRTHNQEKYRDNFKQSSRFWDARFVDRIHGDTYFSVRESGIVIETLKANRFKASYHNAENGLLTYLYLNAWIHKEPTELYFKMLKSEKVEECNFSPIEGDALRVQKISHRKDGSLRVILTGNR